MLCMSMLVSRSPGGAAVDGDDLGVVDDAIHGRGGDDLVATSPQRAKGRLGVRIQPGVLVAGGDPLEEQVGGVLLERGCCRPRRR
jgi:hypothetical protein